jgi:hypothetical protein
MEPIEIAPKKIYRLNDHLRDIFSLIVHESSELENAAYIGITREGYLVFTEEEFREMIGPILLVFPTYAHFSFYEVTYDE